MRKLWKVTLIIIIIKKTHQRFKYANFLKALSIIPSRRKNKRRVKEFYKKKN